MVETEYLFRQYSLSAGLSNNLQQAKTDVDAIPEEQFLGTDDETLFEHVYSQREVNPLVLDVEARTMEQSETKIDVRHDSNRAVFDRSKPCLIPGLRITVSIPFSGDSDLWRCQPNSSDYNPPRADVHSASGGNGGHIALVYERPSDKLGDGTELRGEIDRAIGSIQRYLEWQRSNILQHHIELAEHIKRCVAARREKLGRHLNVLANLGIPMKKKEGAPDYSRIPVTRKIVKPLPAPTKTPVEPGISENDFKDIIEIIRHAGRSFEETPNAFNKHDEEELRDIIAANLNSIYKGMASGETFRKEGKTDIRIIDSERNAFIAECKVWHGAKEVTVAIDQLLGYLIWRDCKASLIIFNKNVAGFKDIQDKLPEVIKSHPNCIRQERATMQGEWRFVLKAADDEDRHIVLHVFLFNIYVKKK